MTKWNILKPRKDIDHGISVYYMKEGFKISKVFDAADRLVYWYCDIIETEYRPNENTYIFHDLLIDVLIYPDKHVEVVDLDEFAVSRRTLHFRRPLLANALRRRTIFCVLFTRDIWTSLQSPSHQENNKQIANAGAMRYTVPAFFRLL